jgi:hypothetical protein
MGHSACLSPEISRELAGIIKTHRLKNWGMEMNYETCSLCGFLITGGFN